jgi:AraC family transcriptional regulator of arabinose operon
MARSRRDDSDERVSTVVGVVQRELQRAWTVEQMAAIIGVKDSQLRRLFVQTVGASPRQLLTRLRLEAAAELLKDPSLRVKEIIGRVGAGDASHFCRDFRKHYGVSPLHYRSRTRATAFADLANKNTISPIDRPLARTDDRGR